MINPSLEIATTLGTTPKTLEELAGQDISQFTKCLISVSAEARYVLNSASTPSSATHPIPANNTLFLENQNELGGWKGRSATGTINVYLTFGV